VASSISYGEAVAWINRFADVIAEQRQELTRLDTAIGDADHGTNMDRGMRAAIERVGAIEGDDDIGAAFKAVGMALVSKVGGAAGPLYGTLFLQMGNATAGASELDLAGWSDALAAGLKGVETRGKAEPGDKTMVDALMPAVEALQRAQNDGAELSAALEQSAAAARKGMEDTVPLVARKGRASYLGERSAGHQDPGATSSYLLVQAAVDTFG
jgi:phosphoenolpyruvate---glycerone phosphotransferase subunit DhaL